MLFVVGSVVVRCFCLFVFFYGVCLSLLLCVVSFGERGVPVLRFTLFVVGVVLFVYCYVLF